MPEQTEGTTTQQRVTCQVAAGVADVRMARPDKLNALDAAMFEQLVALGESLAGDAAVRAVVLSGEGRAFCAGLDVASFEAVGRGDATTMSRIAERIPGRITNLAQQAAHVWSEIPVPTVAAVHGVALGGGLQIALGADLRVVAPDARLSVLEIRWGLVPDMTGTWVLPRLVGLDVAKEMTWTGRMVDGEEAVRLGLATSVAGDPRATALEMARAFAGASPEAIRGAKALLDTSLGDSAAAHFLRESEVIGGLIGSSNQREAVLAFLEKRPPAFSDPA